VKDGLIAPRRDAGRGEIAFPTVPGRRAVPRISRVPVTHPSPILERSPTMKRSLLALPAAALLSSAADAGFVGFVAASPPPAP